jgi:flagellar hook assembly protein FlgD
VIDVRGDLVSTLVDAILPAGEHVVTWDGVDAAGRPVASGVYFYIVEQPGHEILRKMTLLR